MISTSPPHRNSSHVADRLLILASIAFFQFYQPNFLNLDTTVWKFLYYATLLLFGSYVFLLKAQSLTVKRNSVSFLIVGFLLCQILSAFNAYHYKGQPLSISIIATLQYIGFIAYLFLCRSNITIQRIEKVIALFAWIFVCLTILNFLSGDALFGRYEFDSYRGGVRYRLFGIGWVILYCFLNINRYTNYNRTKYLWIALLMFLFTVLSLTRQVMAVTFLLMVLMIIHKAKWYQKVFIALLLIFAWLFVIPKVGLFNKLVSFSTEQANAKYDNIRLLAFEYYAIEYPRNSTQVLFGVGVPSFGHSIYGNEIDWIEQNLRLYTSDIGYIEIYFKFGAVALVLLLLAQVLCMQRKTKPEFLYAKYYLLANMLLAIASTPYFSDTFSICVALYILSLKDTQQNKSVSNNKKLD